MNHTFFITIAWNQKQVIGLQPISSADNKSIKLASSLKIKKFREDQGLFLVEGTRAVDEILQRPELLEVLLVSTDREQKTLISGLPAGKIVWVEPKLMGHFCTTENPQGIAAVVKKPSWSWINVTDSEGLLIYLDRIADPGNLGSILRSCWAFGVKGVLMSPGCVDLFNPKVVRSTMGAIIHLPVFVDVSSDAVRKLGEAGYSIMCTDVEQGRAYYKLDYKGAALIILGSEGHGVNEELKQESAQIINIPIEPGVESLNVAAACAIIVAEARRQHQEGVV